MADIPHFDPGDEALADDMNVIVDAVNALAITPWTGLPFVNGWKDYGYAWAGGAYRLAGDMVQLRGLVDGGPWGSATTPIAFLPVGFRPPAQLQFNNYAGTQISVYPNGALWPQGDVIQVVSLLDGITFSVTP